MTWSRVLLVLAVLAGLAAPAPAGLFSRKPKHNPAERVPELLIQLRTSQDEAQRAAAAEELRQYDPKAFPEIMTALIDALSRDASTAVRAEAADSLGKLRPISQQAGYALEQSVANDGSMRVRLAARQALWQYHLVGYRNGRPTDQQPANNTNGNATPTVAAPPGPSTPASAAPRTSLAQPTPRNVPQPAQVRGGLRESPEPPLADAAAPLEMPAITVTRPQAAATPAPARLIPVNPPRLQPVPNAPAAPKSTPPAAPAPKPAAPPAGPDADGPAFPPPG